MSASSTDTTTATATNDIDTKSDLPKDLPSAIEKVKELRAKRDQMFAQKDNTAKDREANQRCKDANYQVSNS